MDADHIAGRNIPDPDNPSNLQTLCANCHRLRSVVPDIFAQVPDHAIGDVSWFLYIQFPEYEGIRE